MKVVELWNQAVYGAYEIAAYGDYEKVVQALEGLKVKIRKSRKYKGWVIIKFSGDARSYAGQSEAIRTLEEAKKRLEKE